MATASKTFELVGMDRLLKALAVGGQNAAHAAEQALVKHAYLIFAESQKEVPVRYGPLKASGRVVGPMVSNNGTHVEMQLVYGDSAVEYALYVHEDVEAHHETGKAKYLEDPVQRMSQTMADAIVAAAEKAGP